jgi:hypothetical protein
MSPHHLTAALLATFGLLASGDPAFGQTVQQPVVEVFNATTTVSVPDRGSIHLGSVSRAAAGRRTAGFGPFRSGFGYGRDVSHSGVSASVYIHDLREMDAAALRQAAAMQPRRSQLTGYAAHAYSQLTGRPVVDAGPVVGGRIAGADAVPEFTPIRPNTAAELPLPLPSANPAATAPRAIETEAQRFLRLGREAEAAGKTGLAKLHYKAAARHGSREAERLLSADETVVPVADRPPR